MLNVLKGLLWVLVLCPILAEAQLRLPSLVSDGMVLQRDQPVVIWGWDSPGHEIEVEFKGEVYRAITSADGKWSLSMNPVSKGGPFTMKVSSQIESLVVNDVLVGDVWLCSGQSNMVHFFDRHKERYADEIANSEDKGIRQFLVPTATNLVGAQEELDGGEWKPANPQNLLGFSVVAYFFAKQLHDQYNVPIGIINASVGGTPIEAWTSEEGFTDFEDIRKKIAKNKDTADVHATNRLAAEAMREFYDRPVADRGLTGDQKWYDSDYQPQDWKRINIPGYWEDQGIRGLDGVVWYRREIDVPASMAGPEGTLKLGRIVDADEVYVNGEKIGGTGYQYPQRNYTVPAGLLTAGENLIVVRVTNNGGKGGFVPDKPYYLEMSGQQLDLAGYWQYKVGEVFTRQEFPRSISIQNQPTALFNAMIAPYMDFAIKGVVWYQGESNAWRPEEYKKLLPAFIADWRTQWEEDLPFLVVQLPNYMEVNYSPEESNWALMREAQLEVLNLDNTGVVVTIDLGEWNDIHPGNKKPVGERAALLARGMVYGEDDLVVSGPVVESAILKDNEIILGFREVGGGLISNNGEPLAHFAVAGADKSFVWVDARIEGSQVVLNVEGIDDAELVRYAWADNPGFANLYNEEGLPAFPFQVRVK